MNKRSQKIGNITIQYGATTVRELLNAGYNISDFEQIIEEPTLAACTLNKGNRTIAILSFYNLKEKITIDQLDNIPIDLALLQSTKKKKEGNELTSERARRNRIVWTILIHLIAALIYFSVYIFPAFFFWVQNTKFHAMSASAPMGIVLLILPALLITFIWGGQVIGSKSAIRKIGLSLWLILNVIISLTYLILIDNLFTHSIF